MGKAQKSLNSQRTHTLTRNYDIESDPCLTHTLDISKVSRQTQTHTQTRGICLSQSVSLYTHYRRRAAIGCVLVCLFVFEDRAYKIQICGLKLTPSNHSSNINVRQLSRRSEKENGLASVSNQLKERQTQSQRPTDTSNTTATTTKTL